MTEPGISNSRLLLPYFAPYLAYVAVASLGGGLSNEWNYIVRILLTVPLLFWARQWYHPLFGPRKPWGSALWGVLYGLAGTVLWIALLAPFAGTAAEPWDMAPFIMRLAASTLLVPVFEEMAMRGYIFRLALQWGRARVAGEEESLAVAMHERSVDDVAPGDWSWTAVIVSVLFFTAGHAPYEWPASIAYATLMAHLLIFRKDIFSCITAHAVTNLALGLYVLQTGQWMYW